MLHSSEELRPVLSAPWRALDRWSSKQSLTQACPLVWSSQLAAVCGFGKPCFSLCFPGDSRIKQDCITGCSQVSPASYISGFERIIVTLSRSRIIIKLCSSSVDNQVQVSFRIWLWSSGAPGVSLRQRGKHNLDIFTSLRFMLLGWRNQ